MKIIIWYAHNKREVGRRMSGWTRRLFGRDECRMVVVTRPHPKLTWQPFGTLRFENSLTTEFHGRSRSGHSVSRIPTEKTNHT